MAHVGFIGLGVMGRPMAGHIVTGVSAASGSLVITNIDRERAAGLVENGASWADTARGVAEASDVGHDCDGVTEEVDRERKAEVARVDVRRGQRADDDVRHRTTPEKSQHDDGDECRCCRGHGRDQRRAGEQQVQVRVRHGA